MTTDEIERTIYEVEDLIKRAEPKVSNIFLEAAPEGERKQKVPIPEHIG